MPGKKSRFRAGAKDLLPLTLRFIQDCRSRKPLTAEARKVREDADKGSRLLAARATCPVLATRYSVPHFGVLEFLHAVSVR
jgi:hypothetical protein